MTIEAEIAEGWHINAHQPNQKFLVPTSLTLTLAGGATAGEVSYPAPQSKAFAFAGDLQLLVYEGTVPLRTAVTVPADFSGDALPIEAVLHFQACDDSSCQPPTKVSASLSLPIASLVPGASGAATGGEPLAVDAAGSARGAQFASLLARYGLVLTLGAVLLLGLGLNLTPCVYPLISVTIAYFGGQAHGRGRTTWLASLYVVGIAASFSALGLAAAMSGGIFGAALQQPAVVLFIVALMVGLSLSSFGLYQLQPPVGAHALGGWQFRWRRRRRTVHGPDDGRRRGAVRRTRSSSACWSSSAVARTPGSGSSCSSVSRSAWALPYIVLADGRRVAEESAALRRVAGVDRAPVRLHPALPRGVLPGAAAAGAGQVLAPPGRRRRCRHLPRLPRPRRPRATRVPGAQGGRSASSWWRSPSG